MAEEAAAKQSWGNWDTSYQGTGTAAATAETTAPASEEKKWREDDWHKSGDPWQANTPQVAQRASTEEQASAPQQAQRASTEEQVSKGGSWTDWSTTDAGGSKASAQEQPAEAAAANGNSNGWGHYSGSSSAAKTSFGNGASAGTWNWSGASTEKSAAPQENIAKASRQKHLQMYQTNNKNAGILSKKTWEELDIDDTKLFEEERLCGAGIDFDEIYNEVKCEITGPKTENLPKALSTFADLYTMFKEQIPAALEDNIRRCRYAKPTPVQKFVLPCALSGRDVMCCAQTGSGKTIAYLIPVLASMIKGHDTPVGELQAPFEGPVKPDCVIIAPTRELTLQIYDDARRFCHRTPYRVIRIYGQEAAKDQLVDVAKGADVVISTPGRLWDYVSADVVNVKQVNCLVLDEADRMLDKGMDQWIRPTITAFGMPAKENRQTMMFSATFPPEVQLLAQAYLFEHVWVKVGVLGGAVTTVTQLLQKVPAKDKVEALMRLVDEFFELRDKNGETNSRLMIFTNSKKNCKAIDEHMFEKLSIDSCALHGDLEQAKREEHLISFRKGDIDVLVCTDVASRGLDIQGVTTVINYDLPKDIGTYVQRIGRTGRIGHRGKAISFLTLGDRDGQFYDDESVLKDLIGVMKDAGADVPPWLENHFTGKENQDWTSWDKNSWRREEDKKDVRDGDYES
mmetsp:Transcript_43621/g.100598  ORF Transcript_43621/g.100598 Transcript_43621/m.100598 type:complete len:683 (+) Transcript_43621:46-2094(+)